jgi:transcription termination factor Rho
MDGVIFEEYKSTGNAELKLDRQLAEGRIFPAIDVGTTGTRHDELIVGKDELAVLAQIRRALTSGDRQQSLKQLLDQLRSTPDNRTFLRRIALSLPA